MEDKYIEQYALEQLRLQRHDFMNYLQVIYGYIQVNKPNDAINYIKKINKFMVTLSKIYSLECDIFGMIFQEFINKCCKFYIEIELDLRIEYISCEHFSKDIEKKKKLFDTLTDKMLEEINSIETDNKRLYIHICGLPDTFYMIISNKKEINGENYYSYMISMFKTQMYIDKSEEYIFYKRSENAALLLEFK